MVQVRQSIVPKTPVAPQPLPSAGRPEPQIELLGVVVAVVGDQPMLLTTGDQQPRLPAAGFNLAGNRSLDDSLRAGIRAETGMTVGLLDQLQCVVAAAPAADTVGGAGRSQLSVGYLALSRAVEPPGRDGTWRPWYDILPWEDWRNGRPRVLREAIGPGLQAWAGLDLTPDAGGLTRAERVRMLFALDGARWDEELVVERFDLLGAARLIPSQTRADLSAEHQRLLAIAIGRLRAKLKSRPIVFELMPDLFTLFELQRTVEAILGPHLHKQNFRRLVEHMGLVEPTDEVKNHTGGRPARLYRFRQSVLLELQQPGVRVRTSRG